MENLTIREIMDIDFLQKFQDSFAKAVGVASIIVDADGNPITNPSNFTDFCMKYTRGTKEGLKRCMKCDADGGNEAGRTCKASTYYCHAGLMDFAAPIIINGKQIGSILGGQVLPNQPDRDKFRKIADEIGVDPDKYLEALDKIKILPEENIRAASELLFLVSNALSDLGYQKQTLMANSKLINDLSSKLHNNMELLIGELEGLSGKSESLATITSDLSEETSNTKSYVNETDKILGFIKNIANDTKLLGFNASIEAARANEFGKGFSVVALQIQKLAAQSVESTKNIDQILKNIKNGAISVEKKCENLDSIVSTNTDFVNEVKNTIISIDEMITELRNAATIK